MLAIPWVTWNQNNILIHQRAFTFQEIFNWFFAKPFLKCLPLQNFNIQTFGKTCCLNELQIGFNNKVK